MTKLFITSGVLLLLVSQTFAPCAAASVIRKDVPYTIRGKTVAEINRQISENGMDKFVVVTVQPDSEVKYSVLGSTCKVKSVERMVNVTVRYPVLADGVSPKLRKRWKAFMAVMMQPIDYHMQQARSEAAALDAFWQKDFSMPGDPRCVRLNKLLTDRALSVTDRYEALGKRYQTEQMRPGGPIERATKEFNKAP